jgi:hypothetical protein
MDGCHSNSAPFKMAWNVLPTVVADRLAVAVMIVFLEGEGSIQICTTIAISITADDHAQVIDLAQAPPLANLVPIDVIQVVTHGWIEASTAVEVVQKPGHAAVSATIADPDVRARRAARRVRAVNPTQTMYLHAIDGDWVFRPLSVAWQPQN